MKNSKFKPENSDDLGKLMKFTKNTNNNPGGQILK